MPRGETGAMSGGQCLSGAIDLYAAAGRIRLQLTALQAALLEQQKVTQ